MANSSPTSSSSSNGSGGGSRRKSTSSRMLTSQEEDRLGKVVTSKQTFCSKIQQGRGAMVCIFLELKDVNGGENPGEPMDIEAHPLLSNAERASSDNERLKMNFKGTIVPQFRDFLYTHSTTLDADTPIRCLIGGYGARFTSRKVVMFDKDELVVRLWPPSQLKANRQSKRSNLGEGSSSQSSDNGDESHLWFTRYRIEEPQATQLDDMSPTAPNLSAPVENSQAVDALIGIGAHAFDAQHAQESNDGDGGGNDGDGGGSHVVASQGEGEEQEPHDADETAMQEPVAQQPVAQQPIAQQPTSDPASEPSSWPSDLVASPPPASPQHDSPQPDSVTNSGVPAASQPEVQDGEAPANLSAALQDDAHIGDENTAEEPPAASTPPPPPPPPPPSAEHTAQPTAGDDWFATPQQKQQHEGPSGSAPPDDDPNAPDASELLAEAEATQNQQQQAMPPPQHPSSWPSVKPLARLAGPSSNTPVTLLNDCNLDGARYKFIAIVHTCQTPRRTNGASKDYSMQVVLVDRSGYLKTMFFASRAEDLAMLAVGTTILVEPVNIQEWPGARNSRQGRADKGQWKAACMLVPSPEEPVNSGSMATRSTLRPTEQEYHDMLALRNWYHFDGGSEESIRKYPMAWIRPTKTVAEIKGKPTEWGGNEFFDLLAQVLEFYPPLGPNQPASVYVTDYTWHDGLRAIYEQHLGYEEDEYMPRAVKTKIGGGRVLQIALFEKQAHALYGLERGRFVLFTSLRSRWTADYGLSAAVGSDTDFSLRLREGSHDPGMPQLLARKKEWEAQRAVEKQQRREAEEENEEAWREAHEQEIAAEEEGREREVAAEKPDQPVQVVKQEQRSASAEARGEGGEGTAEEQQAGERVVEHGGEGGDRQMDDDADESIVPENVAAAESSSAQAGAEASNASVGGEGDNAQVGAQEANPANGAAEAITRASEADNETADKTASNLRRSEAEDVVIAAGEDAAVHEENAQAADEQGGRDEVLAGEDASMAVAEEERQPQAAREIDQQASEPAAAEPTEEQEMAPVDDAPPVEDMAPIDDMPHDNDAPDPSAPALRARARIVMDVKAFEQAATSASYTPDAIQTMTVSEIGDLFPPDRPELHDFTVYAKLERAKILDIKPRDSMQWIRETKKKGKELMLALLLAEEGGEEAGEIDPRRCLPVVLSGEQADRFFKIDGDRLAFYPSYEEEALAKVKAKLEGLMTLEQAVEESQTQDDEVDEHGKAVTLNGNDANGVGSEDDTWRRHDWGLAIWVGKKTGKRQVSIWGCSVEDGA